MTKPSLDLYPFVEQPDRPTWDDFLQLAKHEPYVSAAVVAVERHGVAREQALIATVFALYNAKADLFKREVDRRATEVPDFIIVEGKRYDRRSE